MNNSFADIRSYTKLTMGELPEAVSFLEKLSPDLAQEQFRENMALYIGRKNLSHKTLSLIAIAVSLANGERDSTMIHFGLAKKFGAEPIEILDALKIAKMVLMSSTLSSMRVSLEIIEKHARRSTQCEEADKILDKMKKGTGENAVPDNLVALGHFSLDLFSEQLKEKSELMSPFKIDKKSAFLIAYSVSISIHSEECTKVYLKQIFEAGGACGDVEDAMAVSKFITGNKAIMTGVDILKQLVSDQWKREVVQ